MLTISESLEHSSHAMGEKGAEKMRSEKRKNVKRTSLNMHSLHTAVHVRAHNVCVCVDVGCQTFRVVRLFIETVRSLTPKDLSIFLMDLLSLPPPVLSRHSAAQNSQFKRLSEKPEENYFPYHPRPT